MIEFVEGELAVKAPAYAVIQCGGVGYRASISLSTYDGLPSAGTTVRLWTLQVFRQEELALYGFATPEERWLFQQLITVNGVGPRLALTVLSAAKPETIRRALAEGDCDRLKSIPRIGAKIADRIVLELQKKVGGELPSFAVSIEGGTGSGTREAIDALCALGFTRTEAEKAVESAVKRGGRGVEELIKLSLRTP